MLIINSPLMVIYTKHKMVIFSLYVYTFSQESINNMGNLNLIGELRIMKDFDIKPNFSALQREYGSDRHTIKKYYEYDGIPPRKDRKGYSKWDPYIDEIKEIIIKPHVSYKAVYMYLFNKYGENVLPGNYNSLRNHLRV